MLGGKRRHDEMCVESQSQNVNKNPQCQIQHPAAEAGCQFTCISSPKRHCNGVSNGHPQEDAFNEFNHMNNNNSMPSLVPPSQVHHHDQQLPPHQQAMEVDMSHFVPQASRSCPRCLAGEPGHINHILA